MDPKLLDRTIHSVSPKQLEEAENRVSLLGIAGEMHVAAANKFEAGLDKVINVLLVLVLKFGRATTALVAVGTLLFFCLLLLVYSTVNIVVLSSQIQDLQAKQDALIQSQNRLEKTAKATERELSTKVK